MKKIILKLKDLIFKTSTTQSIVAHNNIFYSKILLLIIGVIASGFGQGLTIVANLGLAPWDILHQALSIILDWTIGKVIILVSFMVMIAWVPLKQKIGIGTLLGIIGVGLCIDITIDFVGNPLNIWLQITYLISGILIFSFGIGAFICSGLGVGPRDGLMVGISNLGFSLRTVRIVIDACALVFGLLLGGKAGIGTIIMVLSVGPIAQYSIKYFRWVLNKLETHS
jgi:uncharacterized membrane protein YczE